MNTRTPAHHSPGGGFRNPWPDSEPRGWRDVMRWAWQRRRQTLRGGVMPALPRDRIHQSFPQQPGDGGGANSSQRQHRQAHQIRGVVAGRHAVIEEEQRGGSDGNGGGDQARREAAERGCKSDDANEQRGGVGNGNEIAIDKDGDQSRRCRQGRTRDCAPVAV